MVIYLTGEEFQILGSTNIKVWKELSRFTLKGASECPDLFELPLDGNKQNKKWVFWGANGFYQVGSFDGRKFEPSTPVKASYFGNSSYAAQTFSNVPGGQVIQVAWFRGSDFPDTAWNQQMGLPNKLTLKTTEDGPTLFFNPVDSVKALRKKSVKPEGDTYSVPSGLLDMEGEWKLPASGEVRFQVNGNEVTYNCSTRKLSALGHETTLAASTQKLKLRLIADRTSLEIYAQDGFRMMPFFVLPKGGATNGVTINSASLKGTIRVHELVP